MLWMSIFSPGYKITKCKMIRGLFRLVFFQWLLCYQGLHWKSQFISKRTSILRSDSNFNTGNFNNNQVIDGTREAIVQVIEQSWLRVCQFIPPESLPLCENDLREMMSLLVLASVRRSALTSADSRDSVQSMFRQADQNQDGQVSFLEWFEWLSSKEANTNRDEQTDHTSDAVGAPYSDPMVSTLEHVLSHAVYTVKVASRIDRDPSFLCSAFVAGGVSSGGLDSEVCVAMLTRLPPETQELITATLSLELGSMAPASTLPENKQISESADGSQTDTSRISRFVHQISEMARSTGLARSNRLAATQRKALDLYENDARGKMLSSGAVLDVLSSDTDQPSIFSTSETNSFSKPTGSLFRQKVDDSDKSFSGNIIQTIDLASIPVLTAPPINDEVFNTGSPPLSDSRSQEAAQQKPQSVDFPSAQVINREQNVEESTISMTDVFSDITKKDSYRIALHTTSSSSPKAKKDDENLLTSRPISRPDTNRMEAILPRFGELEEETPDKTEVEVYLRNSFLDNDVDTKALNVIDTGAEIEYIGEVVPSNTNSALLVQEKDNHNDNEVEVIESTEWSQLVPTQSSELTDKSAEELYQRASQTLLDIQRMRASLADFEDRSAGALRQAIMSRAGGRVDVMKLALSVRAARLQHAAALPNVVRQRVAVETLQVWAPLSFQAGLSSHVPELEVHSYVLLFPQSFNSFLGWFDCFRPLARKLLRKFRESLQVKLRADPVLPSFASKVTIQSRIKTPSSAFKKMVKSSKRQQQLHDILGLRVIVTENQLPWSRTVSGTPYLSNLDDFENVMNDPIDSTGEAIQSDQPNDAIDLDDYLYDDFSDGFNDDEDEIYKEFAVWRVHDVIVESLSEPETSESPAAHFERGSPDANGHDLQTEDDHGDATAMPWDECMGEWTDDPSRFKDYVTQPKPSGYQSLHMTLVHRHTGIRLEVQIRSQRMHYVAEYGSAAHRNYKALALPSASSGSGWRND